MSGWIFLIFICGICVTNAIVGWRWSQLDHNPWEGKFLGGTFSRPAPGFNPGNLSVEQVRQHGRRLLYMQPFILVLGIAIAFGAFGAMKNLTPIQF